jgi:ABC-2 type transport system ATP-binding protein
MAVPPGKVVGLLGQNGSGKTTLIKAVNGLVGGYAGECLVCGRRAGHGTQGLVSYMPDRSVLPKWLTVTEAVRFYQDFYRDFDRQRAEKLIEEMKIEKSKRIKALSKGTAEKLQLALVMSRRAKLYVLDEPIASVDPVWREFIINTVIGSFDGESSVLLATHLIADIEAALDYVVFLKEGEVTLSCDADALREQRGKSIENIFKEEFLCL